MAYGEGATGGGAVGANSHGATDGRSRRARTRRPRRAKKKNYVSEFIPRLVADKNGPSPAGIAQGAAVARAMWPSRAETPSRARRHGRHTAHRIRDRPARTASPLSRTPTTRARSVPRASHFLDGSINMACACEASPRTRRRKEAFSYLLVEGAPPAPAATARWRGSPVDPSPQRLRRR